MDKMELGMKEQMEAIAALPADMRDAQLMRLAATMGEKLAQHISPPGECKASVVKEHPLLEERRLKYSIPDKAFDQEAVYDRIFVHQIPRVMGNKLEGSMLYKPESARQREEESAPRGIIVSAGLKARDSLTSHGMDIGHCINFIRLAPFRLPYMSISGQELWLLVMRDGDIVASEDLPIRRNAGSVQTRVDVNEFGQRTHTLNGKLSMPHIPEDY